MTEATTPAGWTRALRRQLDRLGLDSQSLYLAAGLDPAWLDDPEARYPLSATTRLWHLAVEASGDPAIGLRASRFVSPSHFHALGYGLMASDNLREVFERIERYHQVVGDALNPVLQRDPERYAMRLLARDQATVLAAEAIDAFAAIYLRTCRNRLGRHYAPLGVCLTRPEPLDPGPWQRLFRAPITFGAAENRLEFALADFESHLDDTTTLPAQPTETVLEATLGMQQPLTWERRVRTTIELSLHLGLPSADDIARLLNVSLLSLQRQLANEGWRYDSLLDECRQNLALNYLRDPECSLSDIGDRLGFDDTGSFTRAFRRWTGLSPGQFRNGLCL